MFGAVMVFSCIVCVCMCCMLGGKSGGQKGFDIFGSGLAMSNSAPSEMPATVLSSVSMSCALLFIIVVGGIVLYRQKNAIEARLRAKQAEFLESLRKREAARATRARSPARVEPAVTSWAQNPFENPEYTVIDELVLLGEVLGEYNTIEEAKAACNAPNVPGTHIQVRKSDSKSVVKNFFTWPASFESKAMKVGEGWHNQYLTIVHPRLFLINTLPGYTTMNGVVLTKEDLVGYTKALESKKADWNERCLLGNSGTCKWNTWGKDVLFHVLDAVGWLVAVFTPGKVALDIAITIGSLSALAAVYATDTVKMKAYAGISNRFKEMKLNTHVSNMYVGQASRPNSMYDSYASMFDRIQTHCGGSQGSQGSREVCISKNEFTTAMVAELKKYEALPVDTWNCDEMTEICNFSFYVEKISPTCRPRSAMSWDTANSCEQRDWIGRNPARNGLGGAFDARVAELKKRCPTTKAADTPIACVHVYSPQAAPPTLGYCKGKSHYYTDVGGTRKYFEVKDETFKEIANPC